MTCCICLTSCNETPCKRCKLIVHKSCLVNKSSECTCSNDLVFCVLCPYEYGAFDRVAGNINSFVHVLCTQWIEGVEFKGDIIDISGIPFESWSRSCSICDSDYGCTMICAAHGCKQYQHITCAHNFGFLEKDPSLEKNLGNFIFCERHATKESKKSAFVKLIEKGKKLQQTLQSSSDTDPRLTAQNADIKELHQDYHKRNSELKSLDSQIPGLMHSFVNAEAELAAQKSHCALLTNTHAEIARNTIRVAGMFQPPLPAGTDLVEHFCKGGDGIHLDPRFTTVFSNVYKRHCCNTRTHEYAAFQSLVEVMQDRKAVLCDVCKTLNGKLDDEAARFVECENCEHVFHLGCLDPPMLKLPGPGYSWMCEACIKEVQDSSEEELPL